jgi:hypothetical protein
MIRVDLEWLSIGRSVKYLRWPRLASRSSDHAGRGHDPAPPALNGRAAKASFAIRIKAV